MSQNQTSGEYHVLVAIGDENQLDILLDVGCALASAHDGRVTVLSVTTGGQKPGWLPLAYAREASLRECYGDVRLEIVVRAGRDPGNEILAVARQDPPDLILMGWRGARGRGRYLLGRTLDPVIQGSPCDVAVVRADDRQRQQEHAPGTIERILAPASGGPNAKLAIELALCLSPQVEVTALNVARNVQGEVAVALSRQQLDEILEPWAGDERVQGKVVQASSPVTGILTEAANGYDMVMIGASHESYVDRMLFGNIPQTVAARSPVPAIVVKRKSARVGTVLRRAGWQILDILPTLDLHEQTGVYKAIREGSQPTIDFFVMIGLSAAIASFGLLLNSPAVIIGAMLVAPLMAAIFGLSLGVVRGDLRLIKRSATATLQGLLLAVLVGLLAGFLYGLVVPRVHLPSEIMNRIRPNLLDLGVALASGAAGAYALCRKGVSTSLPGVAIAAALVPPLAATGIGLGLWADEVTGFGVGNGPPWQPEVAGAEIASGALLLFLTNLVAITAAGGVVFLWLGFRPIPGREARARVFQGGMLGTILLLAAVSVPLALLSVRVVRQAIYNEGLNQAIQEEVAAMNVEGLDRPGRVELDSWQQADRSSDIIRLQIWLRSPWVISHQEVVDLQERLASRLQQHVELQVSVIPTTNLDPMAPPTFTATPTATPTPIPGSTETYTPSPTFTPSRIPTLTATSTLLPTPTHTSSPTPTATPTATLTHTHTPTPRPTFTPMPTATPTPVMAEVGATGGQGVWMYRQPGLEGGKITAWRDGTVLSVVGGPVSSDGYDWIQVIDPRGRLGWIPDRFLLYLGRPPG